jgi:hypothetical protein
MERKIVSGIVLMLFFMGMFNSTFNIQPVWMFQLSVCRMVIKFLYLIDYNKNEQCLGGECLVKCGLCGAEVKEQPKITAEGKCSVCGAKLKPA